MKAAIFDMDGTLVDSMIYWRRINFDILRDNHIEIPVDLAAELPSCRLYRGGDLCPALSAVGHGQAPNDRGILPAR